MIRAARDAIGTILGWAFQIMLDLLYGKTKEDKQDKQDNKESKS